MQMRRQSNLTSRDSNRSSSTHNNQNANTSNLIYNLPENLNTRSMCALTADDENHKFIVGTCSLSAINQLHVLNFSEDSSRVDLVSVLMFD